MREAAVGPWHGKQCLVVKILEVAESGFESRGTWDRRLGQEFTRVKAC